MTYFSWCQKAQREFPCERVVAERCHHCREEREDWVEWAKPCYPKHKKTLPCYSEHKKQPIHCHLKHKKLHK